METKEKSYTINFFKPHTATGKTDRTIIVSMVLIWAIAVFGFQIALKVLETPTPEKTLGLFNAVQAQTLAGTATVAEQQGFVQALLSVRGKALPDDKKTVLNACISWAVYSLVSGDASKEELVESVQSLATARGALADLEDEELAAAKRALDMQQADMVTKLSGVVGLAPETVRAQLLPYTLVTTDMQQLNPEAAAQLPAIMNLYLIHNQSVLTDTVFLGFPFHYWYTAEGLLILFVALCIIYCVLIDRVHKKNAVKEDL